MHRFYCPHARVTDTSITVSAGEQLHHMKDTLRLKKGETVVVFDERAQEYEAAVEEIHRDAITLTIRRKIERPQGGSLDLTIACALPKQARMDDIVDKLTQLGVCRIIPLVSERVIVRWDRQKGKRRQKRWLSIALGASEQSRRNTIPQIDEPTSFDALMESASAYDLRLIPTLGAGHAHLKQVLTEQESRKLIVLIGPEGDFSPAEVTRAEKCGFIPVTMGERVLRVDTAAVSAAAYIILHAEG